MSPLRRAARRVDRSPLVGFLILIACVSVGIHFWAKRTADDAIDSAVGLVQRISHRQLVQGCERTNVLRAYLLQRAKEVRSPTASAAKYLFHVVNCEATYRVGYQGPTINLVGATERCFIRLESVGYWNARSPISGPVRLRRLCATHFG